MGFVSEFREFALKGNVLDLAIGVIIGAAFGKIVNSLIEDVIMPVVGLAGNVDFTNAYYPLSGKVQDAADKAILAGKPLTLTEARAFGPVIAWGNFVTITINFIILAFCVFLVVKLANAARRRFERDKIAPPPAGPSSTDKLLMEIRDEMKQRR
ncbi:large conductance mechanosensitive channel protein MscL [soil metagenome]